MLLLVIAISTLIPVFTDAHLDWTRTEPARADAVVDLNWWRPAKRGLLPNPPATSPAGVLRPVGYRARRKSAGSPDLANSPAFLARERLAGNNSSPTGDTAVATRCPLPRQVDVDLT